MEKINGIYNKRLYCFNELSKCTESMKTADEEYIKVSLIERKEHINAYERLEYYTTEYKKIYKQCYHIINKF